MVDPLEEAKQVFYARKAEVDETGYIFNRDLAGDRGDVIELALIYINLLETTLEHVQEMKQYWMDMMKPPTHFHIDL